MVVDDQAVVRAGFAAIVDAEPDLTVVAQAGDGASAVALAADERPDLVLMDIRMPGMDGLAATELLRAQEGAPEVIVLTTFASLVIGELVPKQFALRNPEVIAAIVAKRRQRRTGPQPEQSGVLPLAIVLC